MVPAPHPCLRSCLAALTTDAVAQFFLSCSVTAVRDGRAGSVRMGRGMIMGRKHIGKSNCTRIRRKKILKNRPVQQVEEPVRKLGTIRFTIMAFPKSPEQDICYICGDDEHMEHFCPYNHIYGGYDGDSDTCSDTCRGHRISSKKKRKFLLCFIRVSNLPSGFREWDLKDPFGPFGPLLMWDVPTFDNQICGCTSEIRMSFGYLVFKKREDGERAINELNGHEVMGRKLRVDWVYPSCV